MARMNFGPATVKVAFLLAALGAGCHATASTPPPATAATAEDDAESSALMEHHRYHHGGVALFIAMSLDTLGVSPEQRGAIEKIQADLRVETQPVHEAERELLGTLADGLGDTGFDAAKVDGAVSRVSLAATGVHDAAAKTLNELHDILTPPQRVALVDKVEAHWAVWREENDGDASPLPRADRGHLAALTNELGLTPDQVAKIRARLADGGKGVAPLDRQEVAAQLRAFGDAFCADAFDARVLGTKLPTDTRLVGWGAGHLARVVETMGPILTPAQRATFAQTLRNHADHGAGEGSS
ncbi:MAG TPA: Spy/CpxP family protein refolding chaperone [Polyangia bacterium]|nr:Spy/CpxP family protein refolding chaperone [Polyangia bacterium]